MILDRHLCELPARYADLVNRRRPDLLSSVFSPTIVWTLPGVEPVVGIDAAIVTLAKLLEPYPHLLQIAGASFFDVAGDQVIARTPIVELARDSTGANIQMSGIYTDEIESTSEGWRFSARRFEFFHRVRTVGAGKFYDLTDVR